MRPLGSALLTAALVALYTDAAVRIASKLLALRNPDDTIAGESFPPPRHTTDLPPPPPPPPPSPLPLPTLTAAQLRRDASASRAAVEAAAADEREALAGIPEAEGSVEDNGSSDECGAHRLLYGNMDEDLAPWHALGVRVGAEQMGKLVEFVRVHRGRWDSWVSDTMTPILVRGGEVYLSAGPPTKDPTNYFWTVLRDLQELARTARLPDVEFLLNMADKPIVRAEKSGRPSAPGVPVFSYCKRDGYLDVLVPGYYSPDRVCGLVAADEEAAAHPWATRREVAFARYTHFCAPQQQADVHGRALPPCARSYFAALGATTEGSALLDVRPTNTVNDTSDPSLEYGRRLLRNGTGLPLAQHAKYKCAAAHPSPRRPCLVLRPHPSPRRPCLVPWHWPECCALGPTRRCPTWQVPARHRRLQRGVQAAAAARRRLGGAPPRLDVARVLLPSAAAIRQLRAALARREGRRAAGRAVAQGARPAGEAHRRGGAAPRVQPPHAARKALLLATAAARLRHDDRRRRHARAAAARLPARAAQHHVPRARRAQRVLLQRAARGQERAATARWLRLPQAGARHERLVRGVLVR